MVDCHFLLLLLEHERRLPLLKTRIIIRIKALERKRNFTVLLSLLFELIFYYRR